MDLKTFLLARIAEDEEQAEACRVMGWIPAKKYGITVTHPTRVLAECAAKRAMIDFAEQAGMADRTLEAEGYGWDDTETGMLRALAAVYADHQDYQPEWAQEASQA